MAKEKCEIDQLKTEYNVLKKKYSWPSFEEVDADFEIHKVDSKQLTVREVKRVFLHKLDQIVALLEPILDPGHNLHSAVETKLFEQHDSEAMFRFYKKLFHLIHEGIYVTYVDEKAEATYINDLWKIWPEIKKEAGEYAKKISDGWAKAEDDVFSGKYLQ